MNPFKKSVALLSLGLAGAVFVGCNQDVDQQDLVSARENVEKEMRETEMTREKVNEEIAEKEREAESIRHEVMKPNSEQVQEAEQELTEARKEGEAKIEEELQETRDANAKLAETEARLDAQNARDSFLAEHQQQLVAAELKIEELEKSANAAEGTSKEVIEAKIELIQTAHSDLKDAIDAVNAVDSLKWQTKMAPVEEARGELDAALSAADEG